MTPEAAGWLGKLGALDFAGGTVVHIAAGLSGLAAILVLAKRRGYPEHAMHPNSMVLTLVGAGLLWFGWFGFNGGSALASNSLACSALAVSQVAAAAAALSWVVVEWLHGRVALGHTIRFDLAVIAAEARRHRQHFPVTASLCLAELSAAVLPDSAAVDLDQLAHAFRVSITARHTARGDAEAAAAIWARLLPHLLDRGIHTFGEARRAAAAARELLSIRRRSRF